MDLMIHKRFTLNNIKILNNMNSIELKPTENEDHYRLILNGVDVTGEQERSVFRHIIETIDNGIEVGI
jgi:hypothetical protein